MEKVDSIKEQLLNNIDNPIKFFKLLPRKKDEYIPLIEEIKKIKEIDYFELASRALDEGMNAWTISIPLEYIANFSKLNTLNVIKFYRKVYESMDGDLVSCVQYDITKALAMHRLDFSQALLEELLLISEPFIVYHISTILDVCHNVHLKNQYLRTVTLMKKSNNIFHIKSAIHFIIKLELSKEEVSEIFALFKIQYQLNDEKINSELINSTHHLIKSHSVFKEFIILYADSQNVQTLYQLSRVLSLDRKEYYSEEWFIKCLFSLSSTNVEYEGIVINIDFILSELIKDNKSYETVKNFLYKWINDSDISSSFSKEILNNFIDSFNKSDLLSQFITESLLIENSKVHKILPYLIEENISLDSKVMETFSDKDFVYICKKVLAYFYEFEVMTKLVFSILSVENISNNVKDLVIEIFVNYIGKNYAHDTLDFFEKLSDDGLNQYENEVSKSVLKYVKHYRETIKKLPNLKELEPPSWQNRLISRVQHISMSDILKEARDDSFFASLGNTVMLSQGRGWFSDRDGRLTGISYMNRISHSVTMPSAIRSHPIHFEWERFHFRIAEKE